MKHFSPLLLAVVAAGCATAVPETAVIVDPPLVIPQGPLPENRDPSFNRQQVEADLLYSARQRFGEAMVRRAIGASTFLLTKHYPGMLPPPPPDAGPDWRYPEPPVSLLFKENGQWLVATPTGVRLPRPDKIAEIDAILANPAFWAEPEAPAAGCTDSGASLLMVKLADRPRTTRRGVCGAGQHGEHLVFRALEA